jgi:acid phosphatase (class A)
MDTPAGQRDISEVLRTRAEADETARARAVADADVNIFRFADVLGPKFQKGAMPKLESFFAHVLRDTRTLTSATKIRFHRDRPFLADPNVHSPEDMIKGVCNDRPNEGSAPTTLCPKGINYSYPSGHSTFGVMTALILAEMVPEKHDALLARGWEYGRGRVINGVHFPTDVEAGRIAATVMVAIMLKNPKFRADLADAATELRARLGLPAKPPAQ